MRLYLIALQFLTIIPIPFDTRCQKGDLGRSTPLFPLVGLTIGGILFGLNSLLAPFLQRPLLDAILIATLAVITGALHLDGLADVCDGLAARGGRERFLAVMKDSNIGAAGAVAVALGLLIKWQALAAIPLEIKMEALLLVPIFSRTVQVVAMSGVRNARSDGLGKNFIEGLPKFAPFLAVVLAIALATFILPFRGSFALFGTTIVGMGIRFYFQKRLGGITGDILGCINEICEIVVLIILSSKK